jgi:hypothetical protein
LSPVDRGPGLWVLVGVRCSAGMAESAEVPYA